MYNYLSNIAMLCSSYILGFKFVLMVNSCWNFYNNQSKTNFYSSVLFMSSYLFGVWNTLSYLLILGLYRMIQEYNIIINYYSKIKEHWFDFLVLYEKEKQLNPEKMIKEVELFIHLRKCYSLIRKQLDDKILEIMENKYMSIILDIIKEVDCQYYINLINCNIDLLVQKIISNEKVQSLKNRFIPETKYIGQLQMNNIDNDNDNDNNNNNNNNKDNIADPNINMELNMNNFMDSLMKQMNVSEGELKNMQNIQQPSVNDLNKFMASLSELQKLSQEIETFDPQNLQNMNRAQRRALKKGKSKQK